MTALEGLYAHRQAEQVDRLAHHALRGEVWDKAVTYGRQAGARAVERSALREAAEAFEQALAALQHLPDNRATREQAIDLCFDLRNALHPLHEERQLLTHLRQAEPLAEALGDQRRLGHLAGYLSVCLRHQGHTDKLSCPPSARWPLAQPWGTSACRSPPTASWVSSTCGS